MPYDEVARAASPRGEVLLRERGDGVVELRVNGVFVMDTAETGSEEALATAALRLVDRPAAVLVGGLGLGFTARAVLADPRVRRLVVAEIEPALVAWMRAGTIPGGPALLDQDRLDVVVDDVRAVVGSGPSATYDLVLLDVDNGPGYLVHDANAALYRAPFLREVREVLRPGGAVVIWAANEAPELEAALSDTFGGCRRIVHPVTLQGRREEYLLYLSRAEPTAG
ncbi:MAG: hypothetical protein ACTHNS_09510 [Marmoricola sp.]